MRWFDIPQRYIRMYLRNTGRLGAGETLRLVNALMVGNGMLNKETASEIVDEWQRKADGRPPAEEEMTDMHWLRQLQLLGININVVDGE